MALLGLVERLWLRYLCRESGGVLERKQFKEEITDLLAQHSNSLLVGKSIWK